MVMVVAIAIIIITHVSPIIATVVEGGGNRNRRRNRRIHRRRNVRERNSNVFNNTCMDVGDRFCLQPARIGQMIVVVIITMVM